MHELTLSSSPASKSPIRICISNCDKDGSIVAARLASAIGAVASGRPLTIRPDRHTDQEYFSDIGNALAGYYSMAHGSKLLDPHTVVLSSVHPAALYIAETLHASLLPLQLISFAKNMEQAQSSPLLSIVGADYGVNDLWQWNKISHPAHFPEHYVNIIKNAQNIVIVRSIDCGDDCPIEGRIGKVHVNRTLPRLNAEQWHRFLGSLQDTQSDYRELRQWEWGLPDITVIAARELWESLGKDADCFHLIEGGTVDLLRRIPVLWEKYLKRNGVPFRGVTLNAYWTTHPYYERYAGLIPIQYYKFSMLQDIAETYLAMIDPDKILPGQLCAFTNDVGSQSDSDDVRHLITDMNLAHVFWFSKGFDCPDAECRDVFGGIVPKPYEKVSEWMTTAPYRSQKWMPIDIGSVCEVMV